MKKEKIAIFWYRRDLRLHDNAGLYRALKSGLPVLPLFIFDKTILDKLENKDDKRITFIYDAIIAIQKELKKQDSDILVRYGAPLEIWKDLIEEYDIAEVYTNKDYESYAKERDGQVKDLLSKNGAELKSFKDQVIFEKQEVLTGQNTVYTVFTPYSRAWKAKLNDFYLSSYPTEKYFSNFFKTKPNPTPSYKEIGFIETDHAFPDENVKSDLIEKYEENRNYPAIPGTSRMGLHLRFGTVSIRELARKASEHSQTYLNELIWRDFYFQILWNFPHVGQGKAFRADYDKIKWRNNEKEFELWCQGKTGYPLVDAGMHQLNETGFMHNRVRMVTASFLTKHLLIDWRWGEAYFAEKLLDYDLSANNGGWQWVAGSGTDAAPYFRIFNPEAQAAKFDPKGEYIKKWVPELNSMNYPTPMVDHKFARERCLKTYKEALDNG
ncbi:cryptochrome/photolyase family protein [Dyadobacter frigoris]|uniref:Deoxyribodipyrimidine photo-lyase n=1 Tax=Dyadobacter frigoris TaxID=2576211 RepID=A0A4U6CY50_9BACT|nr:deoxyribodipyrimidine photo-lyase [Dyadobacter frigoris]TKT89749.1 deoxyribodipyrimidine photo-lyase [Dyadobacter frigoris]GLU54023.1 deoxyribodipyrimidine photo-lyase [Dyadobacter frigoris]